MVRWWDFCDNSRQLNRLHNNIESCIYLVQNTRMGCRLGIGWDFESIRQNLKNLVNRKIRKTREIYITRVPHNTHWLPRSNNTFDILWWLIVFKSNPNADKYFSQTINESKCWLRYMILYWNRENKKKVCTRYHNSNLRQFEKKNKFNLSMTIIIKL